MIPQIDKTRGDTMYQFIHTMLRCDTKFNWQKCSVALSDMLWDTHLYQFVCQCRNYRQMHQQCTKRTKIIRQKMQRNAFMNVATHFFVLGCMSAQEFLLIASVTYNT